MAELPVEQLWGYRSAGAEGQEHWAIATALGLRNADATFIRAHLGMVGERTVHELRGLPCIELAELGSMKSIISSWSFSKATTALGPMAEALATYAAQASEKFRRQRK